jgi:TolA-binding protein
MQKRFTILLATLLVFHGTGMAAFGWGAKKSDPWQSREIMVNTLGEEGRTLTALDRELAGLGDLLADIRDLELYPAKLTGFDKAGLVRFDKRIEQLDKELQILTDAENQLKPPLVDAMAILREMVVKEPVESMFDLIEQGSKKRMAVALQIRSKIAALRAAADSFVAETAAGMGVPASASPAVAAGNPLALFGKTGQAEPHFMRLYSVKEGLVAKAGLSDVKEMYAIESGRAKKYVRDNSSALAQRKIGEIAMRYDGRIDLGDLTLLAARTAIMGGNYENALTLLTKREENAGTSPAATESLLYRMQSLYALGRFDTLWTMSEGIDFTGLGGAQKNVLLWMIMESGLTLGKKDAFVKLASLVDRKAPYALHVMHALGRSYLAAGDPTMALSVFESGAKFSIRADVDKTAAHELRFAIAETNYELGRYQQALDRFYELLNDQTDFERGLSGALWCYIQLGMDDKVESSVRKLINQAPQSRFAAEALLVLAQQQLTAARDEWKKTQYLTSEEQRLGEMILRINQKQAADSMRKSAQPFAAARKELTGLLAQLKAQPRSNRDQINAIYAKIAHINDLLASCYATGSFQNVALTERRERILHTLDSCSASVRGAADEPLVKRHTASRGEAAAVKSVVSQSAVFTAEVMIEQFRFEKEFIAWQKSQVNFAEQEALRSLPQRNDSASRMAIAARKQKTARLIDSLVGLEERLKQQWSDRLTSRLKTLLAKGVDSVNGAYFRYHLGELLYAEENTRYARDFEKYEKEKTNFDQKRAAFRDGTAPAFPAENEPKPPRTDHRGSMEQFSTAVALAPASPAAGSAHYCMAWCWNDMGGFDSALTHMKTVAEKFPQSPYAPQAWMYAGEYMFDKGNLAKAITCYQAVMKYPESDWFDEALYKLAWAQYRLSNPEKAISSFLALVDLGEGKRKGKSLLEKESMDYIAISFSEADMTGEKGLQRAVTFVKKLGDPDRGSQILHRLAKIYSDQGRYDMAKKTYRTLLAMNPTYRNMPAVESELVAATERETPPESANQLKVDFFTKYNKKSEWALLQPDSAVVAKADSIAQDRLYDAAIGYHQLALQKNDTATYGRALAVYTDFIRNYPASSRASECHYNLAEIEFSLGDYTNAAQDYIAVSKRYPESKFRETAAWNAIVASQNLLKKEGALR